MPSEAFDNIVALIRAADVSVSLDDQRAGYELLGSMIPPADGITVEAGELGGVPGDWIAPADPAGVDRDRTILYLHGGGYSIGSAQTHRGMLTHLAKAARARLFTVDYRLAPEHPYPAALDDATAAYRALLDDGVDPSRLALAGDSAGGGLALALLLRLRDEGVALPATVTPISPWVDLTLSGDSLSIGGIDDPLLTSEALTQWVANYLGPTDPAAPAASPLFADLTGLPPLLIQVGDQEVLLDDSRRLAERAEAAGVKTELVVAADMVHVWHFFGDLTPESSDAIRSTADWIVAHTA